MKNEQDLAFLILIGGKSARFGTEKAVINLLGKPLIVYQIETLSKFNQEIFLVAHSQKQIERYKKEIEFPQEIKFILDDREFFSYLKMYKPMLGVYTGFKELSKLKINKGFLLSCDMPLIKEEVIALIINKAEAYDCCIPQWRNKYLEPFFAIYTVPKAFQKAKWILQTETYGILNLLDENWNINYVSVEEDIKPLDKNLVSLININAPIDIIKATRLLKNE